jgi:hypothetical protein
MKTVFSALVFGLVLVAATNCAQAADDATFDKHGIAFTYPKDWTVKAEEKDGSTRITAKNTSGTNVVITLYVPERDPKMLQDDMAREYRKVFADKIVKDSDKPTKKKLLGAEREGQTIEIELLKDTHKKLDYYVFHTPSKKNTISVILDMSSTDPGGKTAAEKLAESLAEWKK